MICVTTEQRAALLTLAEAHGGRLTPEAVVEAASDPDSPLHSAFTWDDAEAAHQHRLDQARFLIRRVRVDVTVGNRLIRLPVFVRDPAQPVHQQGYVHIARLKRDEDHARDAVLMALARAVRALQDARDLAAALGVEDEIDDIVVDLKRARARVEAADADARV